MSGRFPEQTQHPRVHQSGKDHCSVRSPSERLQQAFARDARCDARDALKRFAAPADLTNRTVIDLGSERGALGVECLRRNASRLIGFQTTRDGTLHCQTMADNLGIAGRYEFHEVDLQTALQSPDRRARLIASCEPADIVFCSIEKLDGELLADLLEAVTAEVCYLESRSRSTVSRMIEHARSVGFASVEPIGRFRKSSGDICHGLILDKKVLLSERSQRRRYRGYRFGERFLKGLCSRTFWDWFSGRYVTPDSRYDHRTYRLGDRYIRDFASPELWEKIRSLYARIAHIPYVQECDFSVPGRLTSPMYAENLAQATLTPSTKDDVRRQVVQLIRQLNQAGVAHRDLHCGNFFLDQGEIRLVDLEFLEVDTQPLSDCYDLTGEGLNSPLKSGHMNAFKDFSLSLQNVIGLSRMDFGLSEAQGPERNATRAAA